MSINVTIWNEFQHEKLEERIREVYPEGIHKAIGEALSINKDLNIRYATLDDPECGLTDEVLENTDVLFWWGGICAMIKCLMKLLKKFKMQF